MSKPGTTSIRLHADSLQTKQPSDGWADDRIAAAAATDSDNPLLTVEQLAAMRPGNATARLLASLGMSAEEFAAAYDLDAGEVRAWELGLIRPGRTAGTYLRMIAAQPDLVRRTIQGAA